jgi:hypothetical protein
MGWISVVVAVVCGALAAGLVIPAMGKRTQRKSMLVAAWLVLAASLFALAQQFVTPALQARYDASRLDDSLAGNATFAALKKHDPQTYERMMSGLRDGLMKGRDKTELVESMRNEMTTLVQKRLPIASDEAATEYMRVMVQEMGELRRQSGDLCYRFLFGGPDKRLDLTRYVSANTIEADSAALSQVVRSSTLAPQAVPQQAEVAPKLQPVVAALHGRYGGDLALLQNPQAPGVDRDKLCSISIDMYSVILQMPPADSGKLIRYLMGQN